MENKGYVKKSTFILTIVILVMYYFALQKHGYDGKYSNCSYRCK